MADTVIPYFDSHAHLDMLVQRGLDLDDVIQNAFNSGLEGIVAIACADKQGEFANGMSAGARYEKIWRSAGVHPHSASIYNESAESRLKMALAEPRAVALGEIGLDYHYNYSTPEAQRSAFVAQIGLARELGLPVVVHTRNADDDTIAILKGEGVSEIGGVIHCFSSGEKLATEALDLGMYLSFSGIVTFPRSIEIQEVARWAPKDKILCETDSPFLSPAPKRGGINTPDKVSFVVKKIADLRETNIESCARAIFKNTLRCFNISQNEE